jgi:RNA 3'-terminal phosphate cyclase (ATP)
MEVDGSQGEGGGQILRTAVAFSAILGVPVKVFNVRAGRPEPGLKRQHLSALRVLAQVFGGDLSGGSEGSTEISFVPGVQKLQTFSLDMGTAASITLVLQAVVPAAALTRSGLSLELVGGTDVPWSPTFDYFQNVARPAYSDLGIDFIMKSQRRGFYPRGGGRASVSIEPSDRVVPWNMVGQSTGSVRVISRCASLPMHVAERQLRAAKGTLEEAGIKVERGDAIEEEADSPGSTLLVWKTGVGTFLGSDSIGSRGKPAEAVGVEAATKFIADARSGASLDTNLADMIVPLLSLAPGPSSVRVPRISSHLRTGLALASQFTSCDYSIVDEGTSWVVDVIPRQRDSPSSRHNV